MLPPALICDQPLDNDNGLSVNQALGQYLNVAQITGSVGSTGRNSNSTLRRSFYALQHVDRHVIRMDDDLNFKFSTIEKKIVFNFR